MGTDILVKHVTKDSVHFLNSKLTRELTQGKSPIAVNIAENALLTSVIATITSEKFIAKTGANIHAGHLKGTSGKCQVHFLGNRTMYSTFAYQT